MAESDDMVELREHLEGLPQELWDKIYDCTFRAQPGIRYIEKPTTQDSSTSRPPATTRSLFKHPDNINLLQVDRASRAKFAASYYGGPGTVFVSTSDEETCIAWLKSIPEHHRLLISDMRCPILGSPSTAASNSGFVDFDVQMAGLARAREKLKCMEMKRDMRRSGLTMAGYVKMGFEYEMTADLPDYLPEGHSEGSENLPRQYSAATYRRNDFGVPDWALREMGVI